MGLKTLVLISCHHPFLGKGIIQKKKRNKKLLFIVFSLAAALLFPRSKIIGLKGWAYPPWLCVHYNECFADYGSFSTVLCFQQLALLHENKFDIKILLVDNAISVARKAVLLERRLTQLDISISDQAKDVDNSNNK